MTENDVYEALERIAAREPVFDGHALQEQWIEEALECEKRGWVTRTPEGSHFKMRLAGHAALADEAKARNAARMRELVLDADEDQRKDDEKLLNDLYTKAFSAEIANACLKRGWLVREEGTFRFTLTPEGLRVVTDHFRTPVGEVIAPKSVWDEVRKISEAPVTEKEMCEQSTPPTSRLVSDVKSRLEDAVNASLSMIQGYTETTQEFTKLRGGLEVVAMLDDDADFGEENRAEGRGARAKCAETPSLSYPEQCRVLTEALVAEQAKVKTSEMLLEAAVKRIEALQKEVARLHQGLDSRENCIRHFEGKAHALNRELEELRETTRRWPVNAQPVTNDPAPKLGQNPPNESSAPAAWRPVSIQDEIRKSLDLNFCKKMHEELRKEFRGLVSDDLISYVYNHQHRVFRGTRRATQLGELAYRGHESISNPSLLLRPGRMVHLAETTYARSLWCRDGLRSFDVYLAAAPVPEQQLNDAQLSQLAADCAAAVVVPPEEAR